MRMMMMMAYELTHVNLMTPIFTVPPLAHHLRTPHPPSLLKRLRTALRARLLRRSYPARRQLSPLAAPQRCCFFQIAAQQQRGSRGEAESGRRSSLVRELGEAERDPRRRPVAARAASVRPSLPVDMSAFTFFFPSLCSLFFAAFGLSVPPT